MKQAGASSGQGAQPLSAGSAARPDKETGYNIRIVHEVVPHADRSGTDTRLMQILKELRAQGHTITFVARNGADREQYAPALNQLGIQLWAHNAERLCALGIFGPGARKFEDLLLRERRGAAATQAKVKKPARNQLRLGAASSAPTRAEKIVRRRWE